MIAIKKIKEHYYGATADYDENLICSKCGGEVEYNDPYIEKRDETICADCLEQMSMADVMDFLGYDNVFDLLAKLKLLEYR